MFDVDDIVIDEITPPPEIERGPDSSSIPYFVQPDATIPIDPAILGDTIGAPTCDWQGGGSDGDFTPPQDLLQERSSPWGNWRALEPAPEPEPEFGNQASTLGVIPSHELLDLQRLPSHGSHMTEPEFAIVPDVFRAAGNTSEDMASNKRGSPSEYDSDRPFKRVRTGTIPSEDTCLPLLPTLCSQFLKMPLDGRLEYLSWLFEGALGRCASELSTAPAPSSGRARSKGPKRRQAQRLSTTTSEAGSLPIKRRKKSWEPAEIELLIQLKKEEERWSDVIKRFRAQFPERTAASIQMYWSTKLKDELEKTCEQSDHEKSSIAVVVPSA